ncbi:MAG: cation diffusion facilitator family transporter [Myxococcota bacterium]
MRRTSLLASIALTSALIVAKLIAWLLGGSVAMLSSLLDSSLDALSSAVTVLSVYHASRPADSNHRFGHSKAEPLAAYAQCIFISASALFVAYESVNRLWNPRPLSHTGLGIAVMIMSTVGLIAVISIQRRVVRITGSMAIEAESLNYRGDLFLNLSVIASLVLTRLMEVTWIDPAIGLGISVLLLRNAWTIGRNTLAVLMDEELPVAEREEIRNTVLAHEHVLGVHDLRTRHTGESVVIGFHLELEGALTLAQSHDITTEVEELLWNHWPDALITIHQEPHGLDDEKLDVKIGTP